MPPRVLDADMAEAGWLRQTDKEGRPQMELASADDPKKTEGAKKGAPSQSPRAAPTPPPAKTGKGAATRKAAVTRPEASAHEETTAPSSALASVKYKRLANVKNNMVSTR